MLKFKPNKDVVIEEDNSAIRWKRRPSEVRGYLRTLYTTAPNGDYLRVDYNLKEKKVRLFVEDADEGGLSYYTIIQSGKITAERNMSTGRNVPLRKKFTEKAEYFASIPNREILKIIGGNYNINPSKSEERALERRQTLEKTKRRYFRNEKSRLLEIGEFSEIKSYSRLDLIDLAIGTALIYGIYVYTNNFRIIGVISGVYAMILGLLDMFLRNREPIFTKLLLFLIAGGASYIYGYYFL